MQGSMLLQLDARGSTPRSVPDKMSRSSFGSCTCHYFSNAFTKSARHSSTASTLLGTASTCVVDMLRRRPPFFTGRVARKPLNPEGVTSTHTLHVVDPGMLPWAGLAGVAPAAAAARVLAHARRARTRHADKCEEVVRKVRCVWRVSMLNSVWT